MTSADAHQDNKVALSRTIEVTIRMGVIGGLAIWCFLILTPFITPIVWGAIIATAIFPAYRWLATQIGNRERTAAGLMALLGLFLLLAPTSLFAGSLVESATWLVDSLQAGSIALPPPPEQIAAWPVIGEPIDQIWSLASTNLEAALQKFGPHLAPMGAGLLSAAAGAGLAVLQFVISIVIAGVLLARSGAGVETTRAFSTRLAGERGAEFTDLAAATVRSVTQGILGVAFIQASLVGIGFAVYGVPHAGLWALICLILAIVQLPPLLIVVPVLLYEYSAGSTGIGFFVFATWSLLASASDNVLKPILLSRGLDLPMLVIFMGSIGGFMRAGFIGLFVGAIVLALGYKLTIAWLEDGSAPPEEVEEAVA